jgi:hypothetical protein
MRDGSHPRLTHPILGFQTLGQIFAVEIELGTLTQSLFSEFCQNFTTNGHASTAKTIACKLSFSGRL